MKLKKYKSISGITSYSMSLIFALCTVISLFSALIFISLDKDAEIINLSGSLRMQSYRLAYDITTNNSENKLKYIEKYDSVLYSDALKSVTDWHSTDEIKTHYFQVVRHWESIKEKLLTQREQEVLPIIPSFVDIIDELVYNIQLHSENKLHYLIWASCVGVLLVGLIVTYFVHYINHKVVGPIVQLSNASQDIRQGNFDITLDYHLNNEIGLLSSTFHRMAEKMGHIYSGLEQSLSQNNQALELAVEENVLLSKLSIILLNSEPHQNKLESAISLIQDLDAVSYIALEWKSADKEESIALSQGTKNSELLYTFPLMYKNVIVGTLSCQSEYKLSLLETVAPIFAKYLHSFNK
ncbi:type IV pili methyl-accepting chemotaxis transducer N-terminal domain-containing protein [Vibrio sp. C8]